MNSMENKRKINKFLWCFKSNNEDSFICLFWRVNLIFSTQTIGQILFLSMMFDTPKNASSLYQIVISYPILF